MDWIEVIKTVGVPVAMLIFFVIKDQKRDKDDAKEKKDLTEEIKQVRDYQRDKLEGLVVDTKETMLRHIEATTKQTDTIVAFHNELRQRPCLKDIEYTNH